MPVDNRQDQDLFSDSNDVFGGKTQLLPLSLARMIWKQRALVLLVWVSVTALSALVIAKLPYVYQAEAVILVDSQKIPEKFVSSTVQVSLQDSLNAISQQVLSTGILEKILNRYQLYPELRRRLSKTELIDKLRRDLDITTERGLSLGRPNAFRISYEAPKPTVAAGVVNDVANTFVTQNEKTREQRAEGTSEFIENQLLQAKKSLDQQEVELSQFKLKWAGELPQQEQALIGALDRLQSELQGNQEATERAHQNKLVLENTLRFSESSLEAIERSLATPAPRTAVLPGGIKESDRLRAALSDLEGRYTDDHPEVRQKRAELARALEQESQAPAGPAQRSETSTRSNDPARVQLQAEAERQRERIATTKTQMQVIDQEIATKGKERNQILAKMADYQARVEKLPIREQQMSALTRDYENTKANYRSLLEKKMSAEMAKDMEHSSQSERFTIADPARVPTAPVKPKRLLLMGMALVGALALGLAAALTVEFRKDVFLGEWELPSDMQVLGRISGSGFREA